MQSVIEVKDLKREYITTKGWIHRKKEFIQAVDGITFDVKQGEIFGLLGQNGAGKTTTIKMLITLLAPSSGICKVLGYDTFGEEKEIRNRINFIFGGEMGVYRRLSARDNMRYFANLYHINIDQSNKQIDQILDLVGLLDKAEILVETYSKGMIQRLQIARGLINNPEIIFMDEPTVGLDPLGARMLRNIIRQLKEQGKTVLLTTHYMYEADELCDRIAIINKGKMVALDSPTNLKNMIQSTNNVEVVIENNCSDNIVSQIKDIKGVLSVTTQSEDMLIRMNVQYSSDIDISGSLLLVLKNRKVYQFNRKETTLEDVYIKLVGDLQ
jgi:ABC-2 type transport system ATP-binding protein